ncbi:hypothetical protein BCR39DRAFT_525500, partial [Naematelia encephala]
MIRSLSSRRFGLVGTLLIVTLATVLLLWNSEQSLSTRGALSASRNWGSFTGSRVVIEEDDGCIDYSPLALPGLLESAGNGRSLNGLRVAVLEQTGFHDEVIPPLARALQDVGVSYEIYRSRGRWHWIDLLRLVVAYPSEALGVSDKTYENRVSSGEIDVTIHVSCDAKWNPSAGFGAILKNTPSHQLVCLYHNSHDLRDSDRDFWVDMARDGRLQMVTLSPLASDRMRAGILKWGDHQDEVAWQGVQVETILPIFPLDYQQLPDTDRVQAHELVPRERSRRPSRMAIVGGIEPKRRRYTAFIQELHRSVQADSSVWGYKLESGIYVPDPSSAVEPAKFYLVGKLHASFDLNIPSEIASMIEIVSDLEFEEFYLFLASMDLLVPAFGSDDYLNGKLSSVIPISLITQTPILVDERTLRSYSFLRYPAISLRPTGQAEVDSIALLRQGIDPWTSASKYGPPRRIVPAQSAGWDQYVAELMDVNADTMRRILERVVARRDDWNMEGEEV